MTAMRQASRKECLISATLGPSIAGSDLDITPCSSRSKKRLCRVSSAQAHGDFLRYGSWEFADLNLRPYNSLQSIRYNHQQLS